MHCLKRIFSSIVVLFQHFTHPNWLVAIYYQIPETYTEQHQAVRNVILGTDRRTSHIKSRWVSSKRLS
jgi:hypothetical protein